MVLPTRYGVYSRTRDQLGWRLPKLQIWRTETVAGNEVVSNQKRILTNQSTITRNQKTILANQASIKQNQKNILANQSAIEKNQSALKEILKNQKEILAALKK
jgi:hypothetical protein